VLLDLTRPSSCATRLWPSRDAAVRAGPDDDVAAIAAASASTATAIEV
jgi:hypothetical protein